MSDSHSEASEASALEASQRLVDESLPISINELSKSSAKIRKVAEYYRVSGIPGIHALVSPRLANLQFDRCGSMTRRFHRPLLRCILMCVLQANPSCDAARLLKERDYAEKAFSNVLQHVLSMVCWF